MKTSGKYIFGLGAVAFVLNWFWEMTQMFAFEVKPDESRIRFFIFCTLASVVDALATIGIYGLLTRFDSLNRAMFFIFAAALGAACAVVFERFALAFEWWRYGEAMAVIPFLNVGLLPFAQLTLLVPLAIWAAEKTIGRLMRKV